MLVAAVIYFVSPLDLVPDSIPVLGLIDDAAVVTYVAKANLTLISSFRTWEILRDRNFNPFMNIAFRSRRRGEKGKLTVMSQRSRRGLPDGKVLNYSSTELSDCIITTSRLDSGVCMESSRLEVGAVFRAYHATPFLSGGIR